MLRLLDQRPDGRRLFAVESFEDLDLASFLPMVDRAWQLDYAGEPRLDFNATVLRRMMRDPWWVAVLAVGAGGEPIGFELALERTLYAGGRTFHAWYASIFSVAAEHRREGLGRWVLEGINRLVFDERGADLIVSTFHEGHSGSPVVQSTFDRIDDWGVSRFHRSPIWSRRLDQEPLPPLDSVPAAQTAPAIDLQALDRLLHTSFSASFALSQSLAAHYLEPKDEASGILWHQDGVQSPSLVGFNILPMVKDDRRLRPIGQMQFLLAPGASRTQLRHLVHRLALQLMGQGCFAMTLLDQGVLPRAVLEDLGFNPSATTIAFAVRGPKRNLEAFANLSPPFFLDFT